MASSKQIYWDIDNGRLTKQDGAQEQNKPRVGYQEAPRWVVNFVSFASGSLAPANVADAVSWEAAIAADFDHATAPMCRSLNASIDSTGAATGIIIINIDANTTNFLTAVTGKANVNAYFRLKGVDGVGHPVYRSLFSITAENDIDPSGTPAPTPAQDYYTKIQANALFATIDNLGLLDARVEDTEDELIVLDGRLDTAEPKITALEAVKLTTNEYNAIHQSNSPSASNKVATMADLASSQSVSDADRGVNAWTSQITAPSQRAVEAAFDVVDSYASGLNSRLTQAELDIIALEGVSLTPDQEDAIDAAYLPSSLNQFLTASKVTTAGIEAVQLTTVTTPAHSEGKIFKTAAWPVNFHGKTSGTVMQVGAEMWIEVWNKTGSSIPNGTVVRINSDNDSGLPCIEPAIATSHATAHLVVGVTTQSISNLSAGVVTTAGIVNDLDTSSYAAGSLLYLSASVAGALTATKPSYPNQSIIIGVCTVQNSTTGKIQVCVRATEDNTIEAIEEDIEGLRNNGFQEPQLLALAYNQGTRLLSLTSSSGQIKFNVDGNEFSVASPQGITISNSTGLHSIYFSASGTISETLSSWDILTIAPIAQVYLLSSGTGVVYPELHTSDLNERVHKYLHITSGTRYGSGLTLSGYVLGVDSDASTTFAVSSGTIWDEELEFSLSGSAEGAYQVAYLSGVSQLNIESATVPYKFTGGVITYNQFTGGVWQQTALTTNDTFCVYDLYAYQAQSSTYQLLMIQGQAVYTTQANAETAALYSTGAFTSEYRPLQRFVFRYRSTYAGSGKVQLVSITNLQQQNVRISSSVAITDHNSLSGRDATAAHPATAIAPDTTAFNKNLSASDDTIQKALDTLDNLDLGIGTGTKTTISNAATATINAGASATIRACQYGFTFDNGSQYEKHNLDVVHNGSICAIAQSLVTTGTTPLDVTITATLSGGNVVISVLNSTGASVTMSQQKIYQLNA